MKALILLLALSVCVPACAQERTESVTTHFQGSADLGKGAQLRSEANGVARLIQTKQYQAAADGAAALRKRYEALFDPALRQLTFASRSEFDDFKKTVSGKVEWIDWGYKECLHMQAFLAAQRRDFGSALTLLNDIEKVAPVSAGTALEAGYILGQLQRAGEGLAAYRRGLNVARKYPSQQLYEAAALRGIGFTLIELKRLDEAETALRDALKLEPGNQVALNELAYIADLRAKK